VLAHIFMLTPVADECEFTSVLLATSSTLFMSADFRPKDVAWGFALGPLIPDHWDKWATGALAPYPADTWSTGMCAPKTHPKSRRRTPPYALML